MCENHLYLINAGFKEEHLNALMKRIIEDPEFNIKYIVLFGYNFNDWSINEMMEKWRIFGIISTNCLERNLILC